MKHAYVSVVMSSSRPPTPEQIQSLDTRLAELTRTHEIVVVLPHSEEPGDYQDLDVSGPVTAMTTHVRARPDAAVIAGLARAVGDFVIEWRGPTDDLTRRVIEDALAPTDTGTELVEITGAEDSVMSTTFYRAVNALRSRDVPIRKTAGRTYSRHALGQLLAASGFEPQLDVLSAELPVHRVVTATESPHPHRDAFIDRVADGGSLLSKGTKFGSAVPLVLASVSGLFGLFAAIYAVVILLVRGEAPEGWTTLMVLTGLGQAAILAMLGLVWTRIDGLTRGLAQRRDATGAVVVTAPSRDNHGRPPQS